MGAVRKRIGGRVRRWRQHWHSVGQGHVYQGRYKSFLVQDETYFRELARYVEANPRRAKMVNRAEHWPWSSLSAPRSPDGRPLLADWPVRRPPNWLELVNEPLPEEKRELIQEALKRGRPLGEPQWVDKTVKSLGLEFTVRPRGRPRKEEDDGREEKR